MRRYEIALLVALLPWGWAGCGSNRADAQPVPTADSPNLKLEITMVKDVDPSGVAHVACPGGARLVGGGCSCAEGRAATPMFDSTPGAGAWFCACMGTNAIATVHAVCARGSGVGGTITVSRDDEETRAQKLEQLRTLRQAAIEAAR